MTQLDDTTAITQIDQPPPCRILVVDDDEMIRRKLSALLRRAGYEVITAANGEEALRTLDAEFCPIVIADWEMPDMDGIALCRALRSRQSEGYIYVLLLTVRKGKRDVVAGLTAGADDYIV